MIIHNVVQGSPEWHALRGGRHGASEASAMMGESKHTSRSELLRMKATGSEKEFSDFVQKRILDKGHEIEAMAREIIEKHIGEDLYPCTVTSDDPELSGLLASLDGMNMLGTLVWENKSWNEEKAARVREGFVPDEDIWQVIQQLVVTGAEQCLYTVTDGTPEKTVIAHYSLQPGDREDLLAGWNQFNKDLAAYKPAPVAPEVVATKPEQLPAITYKLNGLALTSNLDAFRAAAEAAIEQSKKPLVDDQDFADREALCKAFGEAEKKLALVREQVVGEIHDVDQFCRGLAEIGELMRQARLAGEKQVKARKDEIRLEIRDAALAAFTAHIQALNAELSGVSLPAFDTGRFAAAMKGKRTIATLQDAVDTELASMKIEADALAAKVRTNIQTLAEHGKGYEFLFNDRQDLCLREPDIVELMVKQRVADHKEQEARRLELERERIRLEEEAKAKAEAERAAELERQRIRQEEEAKAQAEFERKQQEYHDRVAAWDEKVKQGQEAAKASIPEAAPVEPVPVADQEASPRQSKAVVVNDLRALAQALIDGKLPTEVFTVDIEKLQAHCDKHGLVAGVIYE